MQTFDDEYMKELAYNSMKNEFPAPTNNFPAEPAEAANFLDSTSAKVLTGAGVGALAALGLMGGLKARKKLQAKKLGLVQAGNNPNIKVNNS